ncbi:MAG: M20 family metallopeptidase [Granulosicoccus sp.]
MTDIEVAALDLLGALISAQTRGESEVQGIVAKRLRHAGCKVEEHTYDPGDVQVKGEFALDAARTVGRRRAVVGSLPGDPVLPSLLMFAHPDGEPVSNTSHWHHQPFAAEIENGRLYGWGVADDLAGCAAAVLAIEQASASDVPMGRVVFASTPSKRYARGVAALLHNGLSADAALYLHPAESGVGMREIKATASGHIEFRIEISGRPPDTTEPGHTAFSHLADNPIDKALIVRTALMNLAEERAARLRHPLIEDIVGRATNLHVSQIQCGDMRKMSRIENHCVLGCAVSFPPAETLNSVKAEITQAVQRATLDDSWLKDHPPEITWVTGVTGGEVSASHPLFQTSANAVFVTTGARPHVNPMHTSSDIRNPIVEAGIPCVGLGCLGGDLTQNGRTDEWIDIADFHRMVEVTTRIVTDWCSGTQANTLDVEIH